MVTYALLKTDGTKKQLPKRPTLKQMQEAVGGYIEIIPTNFGEVICNEYGAINDMTRNIQASLLCGFVLRGDVIAVRRRAKV